MFNDILHIFRVIFGVIFVFFVPGFTWTLIFFNHLRLLERIVLSIGLSIAVVTLSILTFSLLGVKISAISAIIIIFVVSGVAVIAYLIKRSILRKRENT